MNQKTEPWNYSNYTSGNPIELENYTDDDGNPSGGMVISTGLNIRWQRGPLGRGEDRKRPNGAVVEQVIEAARQRLKFYQASKFICMENAFAIAKLEEALDWLNARTKDREEHGVEGTHGVRASKASA